MDRRSGGQKECFVTKAIASASEETSAARRLAETFSAETLDSLITDAVKSGTPIDGADGLLNELTKAVLERSLAAELTHHLGYETGDPAGRGSGNSRNGSTTKTVNTVNGPVTIDAPRDRNGSFEPVIVPKKTRRLSNINSVVLSLYSRGMTTRDIEAHLEEVYGAKVSRELISNITEVVVDEIKAWQSRPLEEVYPILYIDGLRLRIKDNGVVTTKVAYLAIGVDVDGRKHALGCWIQDTEGAKFAAVGRHRPAQPGRARHPHRLLRRADRAAGCDPVDLPRDGGADLCGARDPQRDAVRVLQGP